jgi:hypothetical protein
VRILVDMCVDVRVADWLRRQGHDALHLRDEELQRMPNGEIFDKALSEDRVVGQFGRFEPNQAPTNAPAAVRNPVITFAQAVQRSLLHAHSSRSRRRISAFPSSVMTWTPVQSLNSQN